MDYKKVSDHIDKAHAALEVLLQELYDTGDYKRETMKTAFAEYSKHFKEIAKETQGSLLYQEGDLEEVIVNILGDYIKDDDLAERIKNEIVVAAKLYKMQALWLMEIGMADHAKYW